MDGKIECTSDRVIPRARSDVVCAALGDPEVRDVRGNHNCG
ncbi:hypothetical protein RHOER0001_2550 [Rhodococcus erythropolis SK121]|nr:hypothetical protein RHOER0001_2550 [Rhodococcus erythropolis SK121]